MIQNWMRFQSLNSYKWIRKIAMSSRRSFHERMLKISPEISQVLKDGGPIVALETAVITHGLPYPHNIETGLAVEQTIRDKGAVPATIGILNGKICVGLTEEELTSLGTEQKNTFKASRRDFPYLLAKGMNGGTTVSGTMLTAHMAGIDVFATGGIGGVHRGAESSMDVSADLVELGRTPVAVVSAGVKSILDVGRTLEYLETQGVSVSVIGPTLDFPDFFTRNSGFKAPYNVETPEDAALLLNQRFLLNLQSGMLFALPISEEYEAEGQVMKSAIDCALLEAEQKGISGRDVTPFVLDKVRQLTDGASLTANIALLENNAAAAAEIAVEYSNLRNNSSGFQPPTQEDAPKIRPVVIGGSILDTTVRMKDKEVKFTGQTHEGEIYQNCGGVGRNLADGLARLQCDPLLISALGNDPRAKVITSHNPEMTTRGIDYRKDASTATYLVLLDHAGEAMLGVGDMKIHSKISPEWISRFEEDIRASPLVVMDGNISLDAMQEAFRLCEKHKVPVWYEPTDVQRSAKPWKLQPKSSPSFASPNKAELRHMLSYMSAGSSHGKILQKEHLSETDMQDLALICQDTFPNLVGLMITLGKQGFMMLTPSSIRPGETLLTTTKKLGNGLTGTHFSSYIEENIVSVSGAGDSLASGFICGLLNQHKMGECGALALAFAHLSMQTSYSIPVKRPSKSSVNGFLGKEVLIL